jgi:predicted CXXCH cytochrome family protein
MIRIILIGFLLVLGMPLSGVTLADQNNCLDCHDKGGKKYGHYPTEEALCTLCHTPLPEHLDGSDSNAVTTNRSDSACYECHERKDAAPTVHAALGVDGSCSNCHDPHGSDTTRQFLRAQPAELCGSCHDTVPSNSVSTHKATTEGSACSNCHLPHSGPNAKLLRAKPTDLCLSCHDRPMETIGPDGKPRVVRDIGKQVREMPFVHAPNQDEDGCINCHSPHASAHKTLLKESFPVNKQYNLYNPGSPSTPNTYALCFQCHDTALLNRDIRGTETGFRNDLRRNGKIVRQNLHWFHVVDAAGSPDKGRGRSCGICHDAHGTAQAHNVQSGWRMSRSYTSRIEYQANTTGGECAKSCHAKKTYSRLD